jgi:hypothetical protein
MEIDKSQLKFIFAHNNCTEAKSLCLWLLQRGVIRGKHKKLRVIVGGKNI